MMSTRNKTCFWCYRNKLKDKITLLLILNVVSNTRDTDLFTRNRARNQHSFQYRILIYCTRGVKQLQRDPCQESTISFGVSLK
jgi:hypothetical protein